jgi:hypothetical protein
MSELVTAAKQINDECLAEVRVAVQEQHTGLGALRECGLDQPLIALARFVVH